MSYDRTYRQKEIYIYKLSWQPSVAQVTHIYSRRLPALGRKLRFQLFFLIKVDPINLELLNQVKPCFSQVL